jgi:hypothetical protein
MRRWILTTIFLLLATFLTLLIYFWSERLSYALVPVVGTLGLALIREWLSPFIRDLFVNVLGGKIDKKTPDTLDDLKNSRWNIFGGEGREIKKHLNDQLQTIRRMPFVFDDAAEIDDLLDNFIDPKAPSIDLKTYKPKENLLTFYNVIKDNKKMVLLGGAGAGKTTFQRHGVLTVIKNPSTAPFLNPGEEVVPFYIQLRYVNTSHPLPILNHLLDGTAYLKKPHGRKKLLRLAREKRLFLILDGYDEVPVNLAQTENHLRDELKIILSPVAKRLTLSPLAQPSEVATDFYKHVQERCRVWITSRKDFFREQSPFAPQEIPNLGLAALEIKGVDSRLKLIEKVFARYKPIRENRQLFRAELLLNLIERDIGELRTLSDTPLLLIIICRIYAHEVIKHKQPTVQIANTLDSIIEQYLDLLLKGLDEKKDDPRRHLLTAADIAWQKENRSLYIEEKQAFLKYFTAHLYIENKYLENKGAFSLDYINEKVRHFFTSHSDSSHRQTILDRLGKSPLMSDFTHQIKNSGVFVIAGPQRGRSSGTLLHDFPHQRFRELLAAQYFDSTSFDYILGNVKQTALNGLLYVFFRITKHKDEIVKNLLNQLALDKNSAADYVRILMNCLELDSSYEPHRAFKLFFSDALSQNLKFEIPKELLSGLEKHVYFEPSPDFIQSLTNYLVKATTSSIRSAELSSELLSIYEPNLFKFLIEDFSKFDEILEQDVFDLRGRLILEFHTESAEETFRRAFNRDLENRNQIRLNIISNFMRRRRMKLLETLIAEALPRELEHACVYEKSHVSFSRCTAIRESNPELFADCFANTMLSWITRNESVRIPRKLLSLHRPSISFKQELLLAIEDAITKYRPFSISLATEIGSYSFGERFEAEATQLLLKALRERNRAVEQALLGSKVVADVLRRFCQKDDPIYHFLCLAQISETLMTRATSSTEIPASPLNHHVITDYVINQMLQLQGKEGQRIENKSWSRLYRLRHRLLTNDELSQFLNQIFSSRVTEKILKLSRIKLRDFERLFLDIDVQKRKSVV